MGRLGALEWSWIVGFLVAALGLSILHARSSARSVADYFVAGKTTPWWILGTSIVATTFAADTPLVVAGLVLTSGIAGNWFWWSVVPSGMLGVFFFARLWRRSGCLTQAEFAAIRYGARRARALRLFYVAYHGILRNATTLGFVNLAMAKIIVLCTPLEQWEALAICFVLTVVYTLVGGIRGVMWTDFFQFTLAMGTSVALAVFAVAHVGGLAGLRELAAEHRDLVRFFPATGSEAFGSFLVFVTIYWIAATPTDCNGYAVQRLLAARNERHAVGGYLWFNVAHYVLRPWPWIVLGVVAFALAKKGASGDPETAYLRVALETAPRWLVGPALASLLAAYMSTVDTHLNWSASYLIHDGYRAYLRPGRSERHYVIASRLATVLVALTGIGATLLMRSIVGGWGLIAGLLSGMGIVGILRWTWWRVTAWTEIGCMLGAGLATTALHFFAPSFPFPQNLLVIVPVAMAGAAIGTFAFAPEPAEVLRAFVRTVRPPGPGWARFRTGGGDGERSRDPGVARSAAGWALGTASIYLAMFGVGDLLLRGTALGLALCAGAAILAIVSARIATSEAA